jgi:hypothetical protein
VSDFSKGFMVGAGVLAALLVVGLAAQMIRI